MPLLAITDDRAVARHQRRGEFARGRDQDAVFSVARRLAGLWTFIWRLPVLQLRIQTEIACRRFGLQDERNFLGGKILKSHDAASSPVKCPILSV